MNLGDDHSTEWLDSATRMKEGFVIRERFFALVFAASHSVADAGRRSRRKALARQHSNTTEYQIFVNFWQHFLPM
jgi:hypothetical protein